MTSPQEWSLRHFLRRHIVVCEIPVVGVQQEKRKKRGHRRDDGRERCNPAFSARLFGNLQFEDASPFIFFSFVERLIWHRTPRTAGASCLAGWHAKDVVFSPLMKRGFISKRKNLRPYMR